MKQHKRWVITSYIIILALWSLDVLFLTPTALATGFFEELNPVHRLGFDKFGTTYSYIVYPIALAIIISIMYLFYSLIFKYKEATIAQKRVVLTSVYFLLALEITIIIHNVWGLWQYAQII